MPYKMLIKGKWRESANLRQIRSPYDGSTAAEVYFAEKDQVLEAIAAAEEAFGATRGLASYERSQALEKISAEISRRHEELARSIALQAGKPIRDSRLEVERAAGTFKAAAEEAKRLDGEIIPLDWIPAAHKRWGLVRRFPVGPLTAISPFNFPLNLVAHKVAPAMAAGNTVVLKPSSQVPATALLLADIIASSGYPEGGVNVIPAGYAEAEPLLTDERIKMVTFTGSPAIGWDLKKQANKKKVTLELGGNAAVVVEPDADLAIAVPRIVTGAFSRRLDLHFHPAPFPARENLRRFYGRILGEDKKTRPGRPAG